MSDLQPHTILSSQNSLGEGVLWDHRRNALWWTDIDGCRLHRLDWERGHSSSYPAPERVGSFGLVCAKDEFVTAFASGVALYDPLAQQVEWLARPDIALGARFNDGRVDRHGRFWTGTMIENPQPEPEACLYTVGRTGGARCQLRGVTISNGLCFSPDGRQMYFADSPTRIIQVFDVIEPEGLLSAPRFFAQSPPGAYPDGGCVDADGCMWSAQWGAGRVVRYTPDGRIDRTIRIPTAQPTCVCFGGPDLDILCVTTARTGLGPDQLESEPHAGDVFLYRTGVQGIPESEFDY